MNDLEYALQEAYESGLSDGYNYALDEMGDRAAGRAAVQAAGDRLLRRAYDAGRANNLSLKNKLLQRAQRVDNNLDRHTNPIKRLFGSGSDYAGHAAYNFNSGLKSRS